MKSIFIGTRLEALKVLILFSKVELIITKKNSFVDKYTDKTKFRIIYINSKNKVNHFRKISNGDQKLILSAGFPYLIPKKYLKKNKIIINSHPSLLPKYKGLKSVRDAIKKNEKTIGVTVHHVNDKIDDGKIIYKKKLYIGKNKNINSIYKKLFSIVEPLAIKSALNKLIK